MTLSLLSRFQGCLLLTFLTTGNPGRINGAAIRASLESWSTIFHPSPYHGVLPVTVWQGDDLRWQTLEDFSRWLVVLALWHHENPVGFSTDLRRSAVKFTEQFSDQALSTLDQAWLQLWQRLLTLILSERFTLAQLPDLWRSPYLVDSLTLTDPSAQHCQQGLAAIAVALENYQAPVFPQCQFTFADSIPRAIYDWAATPAQPRLSFIQGQIDPNTALVLPCTSALSGAYNGGTIAHQALKPPQRSQTNLMPLINRFAHQHCRRWSGGLSDSSEFSAPASAAPLVMQRRSGLRLLSQQDYGQFS